MPVQEDVIYLDHAATSWPKPPDVLSAMTACLESAGGNPGRSGHRLSVEAGRVVYDAREALAELLGASDPLRVVFSSNATYALNLAIRGFVRPGDHVVTTGMEHNSVMRPLRDLESRGARVTVVPCDAQGRVDLDAMRIALADGARMVAVSHASNVIGTLTPIEEIAAMAHQAGAVLLVDAAQTAGAVPIAVDAAGIDLLAFTGHKGLHGPTGTGGLVIGPSFDIASLEPLVRGGTGSRSEREEQPDMLPDKYESGTLGSVGIAGLAAGVRWVLRQGVDSIRAHEAELTDHLLGGLADIDGVELYGLPSSAGRTAVVSCRVRGSHVSDIGLGLDDDHGILSRVGLHCAPAAHRSIHTYPEGTVRLAPGPFITHADIDRVIAAMRSLVRRHG